MISVITAYYNRKTLFRNTLESIKNQTYKGDFEVIAVDDGSKEEERIEDLQQEFAFLKVIRIDPAKKWYHNSCIPFNIGFKAAKGDKIIIQNPECLHYGNILAYSERNIFDSNYLSFACFSLDKNSTNNIREYLKIEGRIEDIIKKDNRIIQNDGDAGWYNHSVYRPVAYHFCTGISRNNLTALGGFDELFALGIAYDDNEFLERIKKMALDIQFVDQEIVLHQNHYSPDSSSYQNRKYKKYLIARNALIYEKISSNSLRYNANKISRFVEGDFKKIYLKIIINFIERTSFRIY